MYTVKLGMDEDSFWRATLAKVVNMIEQWSIEQQRKAAAMSGKRMPPPMQTGTARSFKEVMRAYGIK